MEDAMDVPYNCGGGGEGESGNGYSISYGKLRIDEKISVVQDVLTLLEQTMSSAKSSHEMKKDSYESRIEELQLRIQRLKQELERDQEDFNGITDTLEDAIQKYLNLENKLLTIAEESHEDYVVLPDLPQSTDIYVAQYLSPKFVEWQNLKSQCQMLNQSTQLSYQASINFSRYKVSVTWDEGSSQRYVGALGKANALNFFRGKKQVSGGPSCPCRFVCLTYYKDEVAAQSYVSRNYKKIIEHVLRQQYEEYYSSKEIDVVELSDSQCIDNSSLTSEEIIIHVQAKSSTSLNLSAPKRITVYQFDDAGASNPPSLTTYEAQHSPSPEFRNLEVDDAVPGPSSRLQPLPTFSRLEVTPTKRDRSQSQRSQRLSQSPSIRPKSKSRSPQKRPSEMSDILSMIGFNNSTSVVQTSPASKGLLPESNEQSLMHTEPPIPPIDNQISLQNDVTMRDPDLNILASTYIKAKGIENLTETQKTLVKAFSESEGDILYEGVANAGKTTGIIIGILSTIQMNKKSFQALIITPTSRSSKLIQKELNRESGNVICQRVDEVLQDKASIQIMDQNSVAFSPVLVGTLPEMKSFIVKNPVYNSTIRVLILHKAEEIFGTQISQQKTNILLVNQILYALDAQTKVIVVRRKSTQCVTLDDFCKSKLRQKQVLEETVEDFANNNNDELRQRNVSGSSKQSSTSGSSILHFRQRRNTGRNALSSISDAVSSRSSISIAQEQSSDVESAISYEAAASPASTQSSCDNDNSGWRTLISKEGMELLGIRQDTGNNKTSTSASQQHIAHLYAFIQDQDDDYKVEMISLLSLEKDKAIIFCDTKEKAELISVKLRQNKMWPQVLHEDVSPKDRMVIIQNYRQGSVCKVLVCTDFLASVSLDSADVVINFDLPKSVNIYNTRASFAVRHAKKSAGDDLKGVVVSLAVSPTDMNLLRGFETSLGIVIQNCGDPDDD